jgi:uncharacterized protein (TIGR03118 family)
VSQYKGEVGLWHKPTQITSLLLLTHMKTNAYLAVHRFTVVGLSALGLHFMTGIFASSARAQNVQSVAGTFDWTNLQSNIAGVADRTDANLVNPWGLAPNPSANNILWVADNGTGVSTLYQPDGTPVPLIVTIPPTSADKGPNPTAAPTGIVFNSDPSAFKLSNGRPAAFIFDAEDGGISAWNLPLNTQAVLVVDNSSPRPSKSSVYKGLAVAMRSPGGSTLYATNFHKGTVDVYDSTFAKVTTTGTFSDPNPPPVPSGAVGWAPFGIATINNLLYITFAAQDSAKHDDVSGPGNGFVDVFDTQGNLQKRLITQGQLNSPWGLARVPTAFGALTSNVLLVGNFGDGHINAYGVHSGAFLGRLLHRQGQPLQFNGLWALVFLQNSLYFTAGINDEADGLFGFITPN